MNESIQKKLGRIKPPRVHITYDLETEGAIIKKSLPCIIGIVADLSGKKAEDFMPYEDRKFVYIDPDNLNDVIKSAQPTVEISITVNEQAQSVVVKFNSIDDLHIKNIVLNTPFLKEKFDYRLSVSDLKVRLANNGKFLNIAKKILKDKLTDAAPEFAEYKFISENQKTQILNLFTIFVKLTANSTDENPLVIIQKEIENIDKEMNLILNQILHDPAFKRLEGTWKGIHYMIKNLSIGASLKIRVLNADINELSDDLSKALEFDQSTLFKKLYEEEYGTYGGNPYTCLLVDHFIGRNSNDFMFLHNLVDVVACAHIPTVLGADSTIFDLESYETLHVPRDIAKIFDSPELIKFKTFRDREDSRYLSLVMPKFMSRLPYHPQIMKIEGINFIEDVEDHNKFTWSNSIYVYGTKIGETYERFGWFSSIIGPENGGMVSNLPVYVYKTKDGDHLVKCPTEATITDRREKELSEQGFIALCYCKDTDYSVFFSGQSINRPLLFDKAIANSNARLSARFQYILNTSRFAHYIKCIMRDKIGTFSTRVDIEEFLNRWISQYVLLSPEASQEIKAEYPLSEAKVVVVDMPGKPGCYNAIIYLKPHFQMEELTVSLRLVAKIPGGE
jgi:type VI secretion system protein ImpC